MKKLLAMLLSLLMLFALVPAAIAEDADVMLAIAGGEVAVNLKKIDDQEYLAVPVTLTGVAGETLIGVTFDLAYDAEQLTYASFEANEAFDMPTINFETAGLIRFTAESMSGDLKATDDMVIVTLYFKVAEDLEAGTEIVLELAESEDPAGHRELNTVETGTFAKPVFHSITADFRPFEVTEDKPFFGTVKFNDGEVAYKGTTPYVVWDRVAGIHEPAFTVYEEDGETVLSSEYYDYEYKENKQPGTGYLFVTFKNGYAGEVQLFFKIYLPATTKTYVENVADGIKITWEPVEDAAGYVIYRRAWNATATGWTAFARWNNTTETTYLDAQTYAGTRYQYGVKAYFARRTDPVSGEEIGGNINNNSGNFNLGEVGPLKTTVRITTRELTSITAGTKQLTIAWKPSKNFTGYQIQYATDANFKQNAVAFKIDDWETAETVIQGLTSGTTYYVRLRSYHIFNGMNYFGEWSNVLSAKVK